MNIQDFRNLVNRSDIPVDLQAHFDSLSDEQIEQELNKFATSLSELIKGFCVFNTEIHKHIKKILADKKLPFDYDRIEFANAQ